MAKSAKRRGRAPAGKQGEYVSRYPNLSIQIEPSRKAQLSALSALTGLPAWRIVDQALELFMEKMPAEDQRALNVLAKRVQARARK